MQVKKITKEKAQIYQQKITNDNFEQINQKFSFTKKLFSSNEESNNQNEMNIEPKNQPMDINNTYLKPNIEIDDSNNSNNNESSNKDDKKFNSSLESQGNTNNSSNEKKKEEKKLEKFNISKNNIHNKKKENNNKKEKRKRKEHHDITTNDIFRSIEEEAKNSGNNKVMITENNKLGVKNSRNDKNIHINSINITKNINNFSYNINNSNDRNIIKTNNSNIIDSKYNKNQSNQKYENKYDSTINISNSNNNFVKKQYTNNKKEENNLTYIKSKSCKKINTPYKGLFKTEILYTKTNEKQYTSLSIIPRFDNLKIQRKEYFWILTEGIKRFHNIEMESGLNKLDIIDQPKNIKPKKINIVKEPKKSNINLEEYKDKDKDKSKKVHKINLDNGNKKRKKEKGKEKEKEKNNNDNEKKRTKRHLKNKGKYNNEEIKMEIENEKKDKDKEKEIKSNSIFNSSDIKIVSEPNNSNNNKDKLIEKEKNYNLSNDNENILPKRDMPSNFSDRMINFNEEYILNMDYSIDKENIKSKSKENNNLNNNNMSEINLNNINNGVGNDSNSFNTMKVHNMSNEYINNINNLINNENHSYNNANNNNLSNINSEEMANFRPNTIFISQENNNNNYNYPNNENLSPDNNNLNEYKTVFKNEFQSSSNENIIKDDNKILPENNVQKDNICLNNNINNEEDLNNNNNSNNQNIPEANEINDTNNDIREEINLNNNEIKEKQKEEDIEMKEESDDIQEVKEEKMSEQNEEIKINEDVEMINSKEEESNNNENIDNNDNNASINNTNTENNITLRPSISQSEINIFSENIYKGKDTDGIPFPNESEFLPCREKEQEAIYNYIKTGLSIKGNYSSLYISGMPGTGKTECVNRVIHILENQYAKKGINKFQYIYINGIEYDPPTKALKAIHDYIFVKKKKLFSIVKTLDEFFKNRDKYDSSVYLQNPNNCHIILILDEVDQLILSNDKSQTLLYNIFNWTTYPQSKLIVISISNTLDLPNRLVSKVQSRMGSNKIMFKPYTKDDLYKIIISRGINMKAFSEDALKLSTMKVAAVNGDLRRAILILKRSKEIYEEEKKNYPQASNSDLISKNYILQACEQLFDSKITKVLRMLQISEKIILAALLTRLKDSNENRISVGELYENIDKFLDKYNENSNDNIDLEINWYEYEKIIYNLLRLKIISFIDGQKDNFIDNFISTRFYTDEFMAACDGIDSMKPIIELINNIIGNNYGE